MTYVYILVGILIGLGLLIFISIFNGIIFLGNLIMLIPLLLIKYWYVVISIAIIVLILKRSGNE